MATFSVGFLTKRAWTFCLQQTRRKTFVPRNPPEPDFRKKLIFEVCKPVYEPCKKQPWETCALNPASLPVKAEPHPYEAILSKELLANWRASRMICFFHINPMSMEEERRVKVIFRKKDMFLHVYKESVAKLALQGTNYEPCLHLFKSKSAILFGAQPNVDDLLKESKKTNQVVLLGGIIDDVFFSKSQLLAYSKLPSMEVLRQNLVGLLQSKLADISRTVNQPTQMLSMSLKQYESESD